MLEGVSLKMRLYVFSLLLLLLACVVVFTVAPFANTTRMNERIRQDLNTTIPLSRARVIMVDNVDESTVEVTMGNEKVLMAHHSYSYKEPESALPGVEAVWKIPLASRILRGVVQTQTKSLEEQVKIGVRVFDIRVSRKGDGPFLVDHGLVFGTLDEFLSDLRTAVGASDVSAIVFRQSEYSPETIDEEELKDYIRSKVTTNISVNHLTHADFDYLQTSDKEEVLGMLKNTDNLRVAAVITPGVSDFIPYVVFLLLPVLVGLKLLYDKMKGRRKK